MLLLRHKRVIQAKSAVSGLFSIVFFVVTVSVWFMNSAEAGIAVWTPPQIQLITNSSNAGTNCVVADNKVYCWGNSNAYGQLGTGDNTTTSLIPRQVTDPNGVLVGKTITGIAIARNGGTVCVVASNTPYCWGRGSYGVLGDGTTVDRYYPAPVTTSGVLAGKTITDIAAGDGHACVVASGAAYCWGTNGQGRLGDGTGLQRTTPVAVTTSGVLSGKTVTNVTAGVGHTCVTATGAAYCWGADTHGALGDDSSYTNSSIPVAVDTSGVLSGKTIQSVESGTNHVCALTVDGIVACWGNNDGGQLGDSSTTTSPTPVAVTTSGALSGKVVTSVRGANYRTCAIDTDQKAYCWGSGPVGDGTGGSRTAPVAVTSAGVLNGMSVTQAAPREGGACYLTTQNRLYCTSNTSDGSLGNNTLDSSSAPVLVLFDYAFNAPNYRIYANANSATPGSPLAGINTPVQLSSTNQAFRVRLGVQDIAEMESVSGGGWHTCGILAGKAYCWGDNENGQLGNNSDENSTVPVAVDTSGVLAGKTILSISAGAEHTCAIASDNKAYCWGRNPWGALGNNTSTDSWVPTAVDTTGVLAGKTILSIAAGGQFSCAIASDNKAYCWGDNDVYGKLGYGVYDGMSAVPVAVTATGVLAGKTLVSISSGYSHTCVRDSSGNAYCWGENTHGELGDGTTTNGLSPVAVVLTGGLSGKTIAAVSVGSGFTCAIASDNQAYCWGENGSGRLGNNSTTESHVPVAVTTSGVLSGKTVLSIAAGDEYACVRASDNQAYCWGRNDDGQLGNNSNADSWVPVAVTTTGVLAGKTISSFTVGAWHSCVIASDGKTYCWGGGQAGQLGNNADSDVWVPVAVADGAIPRADINPSDNTYKLQYAQKTVGSCSAQTGFADVTASTAIAYNTNAGVSNGAAITANANDPVPTTDSAPQTYISTTGTFTNTSTIPGGKTGLFDFSLKDNSGLYMTSYCLRLTYGDGTAMEGNVQYPEVKTSVAQQVTATPYRFYQNANSLTPGNPLGLTDQAATLTAPNQGFRLRTGVAGTMSFTKVSAGDDFSCGIASDNKAYCWGANGSGELGNNSTTPSLVPVAVNTSGVLSGKTVLSISTGMFYTCAVASDNKAYCWGYNSNDGRLGNNSTVSSSVPVAVNTSGVLSGKTVLSISAGYEHACVIASDNKAYCWGNGSDGQLGNNTSVMSRVPVAVNTSGVLSGKTISSIELGEVHGCVVTSDNQTFCWGNNDESQLGDNSNGDDRLVPVAVDASGVLMGRAVVSVSGGDVHTCALTSEGQIYCWGWNGEGELGNSLVTGSSVPMQVLSRVSSSKFGIQGKTISTLAVGGDTTCGIFSDNQLYCWGDGDYGQLGNDSTTESHVAVAVNTAGVLSGKTISSISAGGSHTCVIASDNQAYCWGWNANGQLGNNSTSNSLVPVAVNTSGVLSGKTILSISTGYQHTCVIASDNQAYCWGWNANGQLGNNSTTRSLVPVAVNTSGVLSGKTILSISAGSYHTCVTASDNKAYCWGGNDYGQLGNNSTTQSPVPVAVNTTGVLSGKTILSISASYQHTCVIASDNNAYCWGYNNDGQLGNNSVSQSTVPVAVNTSGALAGKTILSISVGYQYTCAVGSDNKAYCWGRNSYGQLGNGTNDHSSIAVAVDTSGVLSGKTVASISVGADQTCALTNDGQVYCWGLNDHGEFGNGTTFGSVIPTSGYSVQFSPTAASIPSITNLYTLQYALKSAATCSAQTTGFTDVTTSTPIAFNTNAGVTNGAGITTTANDPLGSTQTTAQTYISAPGAFTNSNAVTYGTMALWDFSLKDNGAPFNTSYCLRIAYSDGTPLADTQALPEVRTTLGVLSIGFVDSSDLPLASLSAIFGNVGMSGYAQTANATFSSVTQRLRVYNDLATNGWSVSLAATGGSTALWNRTDNLAKYDFNDSTGGSDGADGDLLGGALTVTPTVGTITSPSGCSTSGVSTGAGAAFSEGAADVITLMSANSGAAMGCNYDLTGVGLSQTLPAGQAQGTYTLDMTVTVVAQ